MNKLLYLFSVLITSTVYSQSFAPEPGIEGSTAIHKDSSIIMGWASGITIKRGYLDISQPELGFASFGENANGLVAEGDGLAVVSLGDSGVAVLTFDSPIMDGDGPDFAIFENGFADHYMEFAFVEVSSDGLNYYRFPSVSETPLSPQMSNFSFGNCAYIHNLAGKYRQGYGTPFDLNLLSGIEGLDLNNVTHIRLIDVVGSTNEEYGSLDSFGNLINDPYPTAFESGGFDLDGVAVIHSVSLGLQNSSLKIDVFPNPSSGSITIRSASTAEINIVNHTGKIVFVSMIYGDSTLDLDLSNGIYFVRIKNGNNEEITKLILHK
jgi:hypothetical protein